MVIITGGVAGPESGTEGIRWEDRGRSTARDAVPLDPGKGQERDSPWSLGRKQPRPQLGLSQWDPCLVLTSRTLGG